MKTPVPLLMALAFVASAVAQTSAPARSTPVKIELDQPAAPPKAGEKATTPAAVAAAKKAEKDAKKKKDDEPGKIAGMTIARGSGFMGIELVGGTFKLSFYDAKKKPVAVDVARAALRWKVDYQPGPERTVLNRSGLNSLASSKVVKPPYLFKLTIVLLKGEGEGTDEPGEAFTVDFRG